MSKDVVFKKGALPMLTPAAAEELAQAKLQEYINACNCQTMTDVGNVLMKICSVAGLMMCATVGQNEAVARLEGTAKHISSPKYAGPWKRETIQ